MTTRRSFMAAMSATIATPLVRAQSPPRRRGIQAVGLANFIHGDVILLSDLIQAVKGRLEVLQLPFNFNPGSPLLNSRWIIDAVHNAAGLDLTITTCLDYRNSSSFELVHDPFDGGFRWPLFATGGARSDADRESYLRRIGWLDRLDNYVPFVQRDRSLNTAAVVHHLLIPMLEDNCPSATHYSRLLNVIANYLRRDHSGFTVQYRRSCLSGNVFRVGTLPLERHGTTVPSGPQSGDAWSPDGKEITAEQFIAQQRSALGRGISCLYWRDELHGRDIYASGVRPNNRTNLNPLSKNNKFVYDELQRCWTS